MNAVNSELVHYRNGDGIATLTMDDGKANVMSPAMQAAIHRALDKAQTDKSVVILAGRPGMFCAGFDLPLLSSGKPEAVDMLKGGFELALRLLSFPTPVVIACTGHALAMGVFILLAGDYRVGAQGAFKIGANEVAIGLTMPHFAIGICKARLAPAYFNRAVLTAEIFAPETAAVAGFLDEVTAAEQVLVAAQAKAAQLTKLHMQAHVETKLRVRESLFAELRKGIESDAESFRSRLK